MLFVVHTCEIGVPDATHPLRTDSAHCGGCPPGPRRGASLVTVPAVIEWPGGIRPWDPIDQADTEVGWQHTYVSPRRAFEIRREIEHG